MTSERSGSRSRCGSASIRKLTESPRYKLAREHHRCPEGYEGPCWGPTDVDYAWADAQLANAAGRARTEGER